MHFSGYWLKWLEFIKIDKLYIKLNQEKLILKKTEITLMVKISGTILLINETQGQILDISFTRVI